VVLLSLSLLDALQYISVGKTPSISIHTLVFIITVLRVELSSASVMLEHYQERKRARLVDRQCKHKTRLFSDRRLVFVIGNGVYRDGPQYSALASQVLK